jgi:uncharacterized protein YciI
MTYFLLTYEYADNIGELRAKQRPAHLEYLKTLIDAKKLVVSGPLVNPIDGALLICQAENAAAVETMAKNDPFFAAGIIKAFRVREWEAAMGKENLKDFSGAAP